MDKGCDERVRIHDVSPMLGFIAKVARMALAPNPFPWLGSTERELRALAHGDNLIRTGGGIIFACDIGSAEACNVTVQRAKCGCFVRTNRVRDHDGLLGRQHGSLTLFQRYSLRNACQLNLKSSAATREVVRK